MKVTCLDGTAIECTHFRAIDSGVLLFEGEPAEGEDDESTEEATGFVPHEQLLYVLPDDVEPGMSAGSQQPRQQATNVGHWGQGTAPHQPSRQTPQQPSQQSSGQSFQQPPQQPGSYGQPSTKTGPDQ